MATKNSKPLAKKVSPKKPAAKAKAAANHASSKPASAADAVDAQLARYRDMRDFGITAEPSGSKANQKSDTTWAKVSKTALPFVIQKHAASHLHYDFRLGWNGVLKSWAVAKGPSYVTKDRRLAVQVEDHPMEYGGFEGIIPKGQYGGGTVMVWDQGTWNPQPGHEDVDAGLRDGSLKFELHGTKMKGKWTLVRMNSKPADKGSRWGSSSKPNWLLIKEHDDFERSADDPCITDEAPNSAVTGRSLEQIAAHEDHVWNSKETAQGNAWYRNDKAAPKADAESAAKLKSVPKRAPPQAAAKAAPANFGPQLAKLPKEPQPEFLPPQLALEAEQPPTGEGWLHELKLDGYRIQARKHGADIKLLTRKGLDWTHRMPAIATALGRLSANAATLDGEVVVLNAEGTTNFADLQASFQDNAKHPLTYFAFDLLHLDGHNARSLPLRERKNLLAELLPVGDDHLRLSEHIETSGDVMFKRACELHAEGIISKRASAPYSAGRGGAWLKSKCLHEQEFVIGGYTLSSDGDDRIGSLLLGYYESDKLIYAGRTGTGFNQKTRVALLTRLKKLKIPSSSFTTMSADARRGAIFVAPELVAQVRFATWTADGNVRQAAFLGLREDKPANEVVREEATVAPQPKSHNRRAEMTQKASAHPAPVPLAAKRAAAKSTQPASPLQPLPIRLTHPEKVVDPGSGLTKRQLAEYYWAVADRMLPFVAGRPLSLVRCPEGSGKPCFYQKHVNHMLPPGVEGVDVPDKKTGKIEPYITLHTQQALAGLAQMGVLEVHPWGSRNGDLEHPDTLILDLDPDESLSWSVLCEAAARVRERLRKAGLKSFLKTTGGKGLHIVAPIAPTLTWLELKTAAHQVALAMEREQPALYLSKMSKAARKGKIYVDYLRNERGATAVAAYSPRARHGSPVSMPLSWDDLQLPARPVFEVASFAEWKPRLAADPWKQFFRTKQALDLAKLKAALIR